MTPTEAPNVLPMSIKRSAAKTVIGPEAKLDTTKEGRNNLRCGTLISPGLASSSIFGIAVFNSKL